MNKYLPKDLENIILNYNLYPVDDKRRKLLNAIEYQYNFKVWLSSKTLDEKYNLLMVEVKNHTPLEMSNLIKIRVAEYILNK